LGSWGCEKILQNSNCYNFQGKCFDIRLSRNYSLKMTINIFGNREEFTKYKGYDAMLYAFKCKKMPNFGDDPDIETLMPLYKVNPFWYLCVIPNEFLQTNLC